MPTKQRGPVNTKKTGSYEPFTTSDPRVLGVLPYEDPQLAALIDGSDEEQERIRDTRFEDVIQPLLDQLPPREADAIEMYFTRKMREVDIGDVLGCTQAAISYLIQRAVKRLQFLLSLPRISDEEIASLLATTGLEQIDIDILQDYRKTTRQSLTATRLGLTQGRVRTRIHRACARLEELAKSRPELQPVAELFGRYRDNPNILLAVEHPQFRDKRRTVRDDRFA